MVTEFNQELDAEVQHLKQMVSIHRQNIHILQQQKARYGSIDTPLWLQNALAHETQELDNYEMRLDDLKFEVIQNFPAELGDILNLAKKAARKGGDRAKEFYLEGEDLEILSDEGIKNLTTEADKAANEEILREIQKMYPNHHIIAEEGGNVGDQHPHNQDFTWVIDAIDGTVNFFSRFPVFCTAIGILWHGIPCVGVIYDPIEGEMFFAQKGKAACREKWARRRTDKDCRKLHTSPEERLSDAVILTHLSSRRRARERFTTSGLLDGLANAARSIRALGSGQLALAYVAQGQFQAFVNNSTYSWDQTAGLVIVEAAGGVVTDFRGQSWNIDSGSIIAAANPRLHDQLVAIISTFYPFEE